jgi:acetylornithine aminotransferase/acetylornithine/N-succinyldiaminopimelate aminotransferase
MEWSDKHIMTTAKRNPVALVRGEGVRVWDSEGKEYLDFTGGIAVTALGHSHPRVVGTMREQAATLLHVSNLFYIPQQIHLAKLLCDHSFADRVFFSNSGAEANETAIKLARKWAKEHGASDRGEIISMRGGFHGRTLATVAATAQEKYHHGFEPLPGGFKYVPFNDLRAVERAIDSRTAGVLVEPIQGEGGVYLPDDGYLPGLRKICDEAGIALIFDEIQTGMGRTGKLWAYEHAGVAPDIMTVAKALANGVPIGATLATEDVARVFTPGTHGSTFGGNPFATAGRPHGLHDAPRGAAPRARRRVRADPARRASRGAEEAPGHGGRGQRPGTPRRHGHDGAGGRRGVGLPRARPPRADRGRQCAAAGAAARRRSRRDRPGPGDHRSRARGLSAVSHFLSIRDLDRSDIPRLFALIADLKAKQKARDRVTPLAGRTMALIFEKPSLGPG